MSYSILSKPISLEIEDANYTNTISNPKIALRFIKTEEGNCLNISGATMIQKFTPYLKQIEILKNLVSLISVLKIIPMNGVPKIILPLIIFPLLDE